MKKYLIQLFRWYKMYWWFKITLSYMFIFNLRKEKDIICLVLSKRECNYLYTRVQQCFGEEIAEKFTSGNTLNTNIKNMLNKKYNVIL